MIENIFRVYLGLSDWGHIKWTLWKSPKRTVKEKRDHLPDLRKLHGSASNWERHVIVFTCHGQCGQGQALTQDAKKLKLSCI